MNENKTMTDIERYERDLKTARRYISVGLCSAFVGAFLIVAIIIIAAAQSLWVIFPSAMFVCLMIVGIRMERRCKEKQRQPAGYYTFSLSHVYDYGELLETLSAQSGTVCEYAPDAAVLMHRNGPSTRILLVGLPTYDKQLLKKKKDGANRKANQEWYTNQWVAQSDAVKMLRINCVVCDEVNDALQSEMCRNAETLLRRVEVIINMAVVGDRLLAPPLQGARLDLPSLKRYVKAVTLMRSL